MLRCILGLALFGRLLVTLPLAAEDKKKADAPDEKAHMEAMMKAATPGEMHKKLEPFAGEWNYSMKMWMDPNKPPTDSKGTAETKWVMGGRYPRMAVTRA